MPRKPKTSKIIWAIDAFYTDSQIEKRGLSIVNAWNADQDLPIEPVFVLNDINEQESSYHPSAKSKLKKIVGSTSLKNLLPTKIIRTVRPPFTNSRLVDGLVNYCKKQKPSLIVVHTSNKNIGARFLFGSFAETLVLSTTIPVFLIGAKTKRLRTIKTILFATDFSKESMSAFQTVLQKAKGLGSKVVLFHQLDPTESHLHQGKTTYYKQSSQVKKWLNLAAQEDVPLKLQVSGGAKNKMVSILNHAEKSNANMIALVARSGPLKSILLGSTTRQLSRNSKTPLWILHPEK